MERKNYFVNELKSLLDNYDELESYNTTVDRYLKILLQQLGGHIKLDPFLDKNNHKLTVSFGLSGSIQLIDSKTNEWINNDGAIDISKVISLLLDTSDAVSNKDFNRVEELFCSQENVSLINTLSNTTTL